MQSSLFGFGFPKSPNDHAPVSARYRGLRGFAGLLFLTFWPVPPLADRCRRSATGPMV